LLGYSAVGASALAFAAGASAFAAGASAVAAGASAVAAGASAVAAGASAVAAGASATAAGASAFATVASAVVAAAVVASAAAVVEAIALCIKIAPVLLCLRVVDMCRTITSPYSVLSTIHVENVDKDANRVVPSVQICFDTCSNNASCTNIMIQAEYGSKFLNNKWPMYSSHNSAWPTTPDRDLTMLSEVCSYNDF